MSAAGRLVVVAGATSASGLAVCRALVDAGARVVAVGRDPGRLAELAEAVPGTATWLCDLADALEVAGLAAGVHEEFGRVDGLVSLVGGWRGGDGIPEQSEEDWEFLEGSLTALRMTSRELYPDLVASDAGRLAIVSSAAVEAPDAGSASYAALKAAAESWVRAVAEGFSREAPRASAAIFVVRALAGLEDRLADAVVALWSPAPAPAPASSGRNSTLPAYARVELRPLGD